MVSITASRDIRKRYILDYIDGSWKSAYINKNQYYYFKKCEKEGQMPTYKWFNRLDWQ